MHKKGYKIINNNFLLTVFFICIILVFAIFAIKILTEKPIFVFARLKINGDNQNAWIIKAIKKGEREKDFLQRTDAQILDVRYYPNIDNDKFNLYVLLKIRVSQDQNTGKYLFHRSTIAVNSPVDFEFPSIQFTGNVISFQTTPIEDNYVDKTIVLTKRYAFPWEFDKIKVGDTYSDGDHVVFEVLDKNSITTSIPTTDNYGNYDFTSQAYKEIRMYISIKARIKVKEEAGSYIFGEEQVVVPGKGLNIKTDNFIFNGYLVSEID